MHLALRRPSTFVVWGTRSCHSATVVGLGEGGEQNAPLGRAVIGVLVLATASTLLFVPVVYSRLRRQQGQRS